MEGYLHQINISKGGVPKLPVAEAWVSTTGILGDKQKNKRYHGGPERALCLFSLEEIECLQKEGHPIFPGSTGENLTISFVDYANLTPGVTLQIGFHVLIQISSYTVPCRTIEASFQEGKVSRISQKLHPGSSRLYARVVREGKIYVGDGIYKLA